MKNDLITSYTSAGEHMSSRILKGLSTAETVGAANLKLPLHSHRLAGFCLILQGGYTESYGKTAIECKPSSVKFHPAGEAHADFYGNKTVRNFIIEFEADWLTDMGANAFIENNPALFSNNSISWLMMKLREEFRSTDAESPLAIEGLVLQLIAEASRGKKILEDGCPRWLVLAKDLLDEQFSENLSLAFVAQSVGVHPVYLAHSFRSRYRCSVGEYLRRRRIEFACHKISASKDSLVDIALASGFSNQSHFSRIFKQITGMSPAQYRSVCR
jgi:AraC family transcriptional regulator